MLNGIKEPILDLEKLQEVANKAAEEAAISEVKSFFTSHNSPYRNNIKKWLEENVPNTNFQLPNFVETVQKSIINEVEKTINIISIQECVKAIRNGITHLPLENDGTIKISNVFKEMARIVNVDDGEVFEASVKETSGYFGTDRLDVVIKIYGNDKDCQYSFTLHKGFCKEHENAVVVISMPGDNDHRSKAEVKTEDGLEISLPILQNMSNNVVLLTVAKLCMFRTPIIVDTKSFYKSNDED